MIQVDVAFDWYFTASGLASGHVGREASWGIRLLAVVEGHYTNCSGQGIG